MMSDVPAIYQTRAGRVTMVFCATALAVLIVSLGLFASAGCREAAAAHTSVAIEAVCFKFADLPESAQPASPCRHELSGSCSTKKGLCVAFVYTNDVNSSAPDRGYIGTTLRCYDQSCDAVGQTCRCIGPAVDFRTSFCVRTEAGNETTNFACVS